MTQGNLRSEGRWVRSFRASALALPVGALPLAAGWGSGSYGQPPEGVSTVALGVHWIMDWLVPLCVASVLAFGTAGTGLDRRVAASGVFDLRILWWRTHWVVLLGSIVACGSCAYSLARMSGEPLQALLAPGLVGVLFSFLVANVVVSRFAASPGVALATVASVTGVVVIGPYLTSFAGVLAIDPTLSNWMRGVPDRGFVFSPGSITWVGIGVIAVALARLFPSDVAWLPWIAVEGVDDDWI